MTQRQVNMGNYPPEVVKDWRWTGKVVADYSKIGPAFAKLPKRHKRVTACFHCEGERFEGDICGHCGSVADGGGGFLPRQHRVAVQLMADLFHERVPGLFIAAVFHEMEKRPHIAFQLLTKRAEYMAVWARGWTRLDHDWPGNVWAGVTIEDQQRADRIEYLLKVPAALHFLSVEPMLTAIDLGYMGTVTDDSRINWVIAGSESLPGKRPGRPAEDDWYRSLRDQCQAADVPFMLKQAARDGKIVSLPLLDGILHNAFPEVTP